MYPIAVEAAPRIGPVQPGQTAQITSRHAAARIPTTAVQSLTDQHLTSPALPEDARRTGCALLGLPVSTASRHEHVAMLMIVIQHLTCQAKRRDALFTRPAEEEVVAGA